MLLTLKSRNIKKQQPLEHNLYWYDSVQKKMLNFKGTRLVFDYDPKSKKTVPRAVTDNSVKHTNNWNEIKKFINDNHLEVIESNGQADITVEVNILDWNEIERELINKHMVYEIVPNGKKQRKYTDDQIIQEEMDDQRNKIKRRNR